MNLSKKAGPLLMELQERLSKKAGYTLNLQQTIEYALKEALKKWPQNYNLL